MQHLRLLCELQAALASMAIVVIGCGPTSTESQAGGADARSSPVAVQSATRENPPNSEVARPSNQARIRPEDISYRGAFRLPEGSNGSNWEYSGSAMTYYPNGDPNGPDDGYPGSLFAVGHDHHQQVSEITIPAPVISSSKDVSQLNTAETLQGFHDIRGGFFGELEIPRAGLEYLPPMGNQRTGKLHFAWGQHNEDEQAPTHGWCELQLSSPRPEGPWRLDGYTNYVGNDYLFEIPESWARRHAPGLRLATGRFRDGRWGGLGPALLAYGPWTESAPLSPGTTLRNVRPLLLYGEAVPGALEVNTQRERKMKYFAEADEWSGGGWLTAGDRGAVVFVGTKATGRCWYGFANGVVYPTSGDPSDPVPEVPAWPYEARGWWSDGIQAQMLFYDPDDLAAVARGDCQPWEPQPYATLNLDSYLFDPGFDHERQKRYLVGAAAFDRAHGLFYVVERRADEEKSVVHVFQIGG